MLRYLILVMLVGVFEYLYYCMAVIFGTRFWNGPRPTAKEQQEHARWITGYLEQWPNSPLATRYPDQAARAYAYRAYLQLQADREAGTIDEIHYQLELSRILPLIDVQKDIAEIQEKA